MQVVGIQKSKEYSSHHWSIINNKYERRINTIHKYHVHPD